MDATDAKKRKKPKEVRLPQRKSIAGPSTLSTMAAPGAMKKSIALEYGMGSPDDDSPFASFKPPEKENLIVNGKVKITSTIEVQKEALCCKYNEEYDYLAVGCSDGSINIYQSETSELILTLTDQELMEATAPVTDANGFVKNWNYNFRQCLYTIKENRETFGLTYHHKFPKYITYGDDLKIYLYDEETKTQERILTNSNNPKVHDGPKSRVFAGCFNPKNNYELVTGGWDDVIHFWDLRQPHSIRQIGGVHICGEGIDINSKGTEILTCAFQAKNPIQLWDYNTGKLIANMEEESEVSKLYAGKYGNKDFAVTGGAAPNAIEVYDLTTHFRVAAVKDFKSAVYSLDIGAPKKAKEKAPSHRNAELNTIPQVAFVAGTKLYQIDF